MNQAIDDLLIEFDEMDFAPTNLCDNPEGKAKLWKSALVYELGLLLDEHAAIRKKAVEEFAEKLKFEMPVKNCLCCREYDIGYNDGYSEARFDFYASINELLKEYEK